MPETNSVAAECLGVKVPASRFLNETRIERINTARYEGQEIAGALHVTGPKDVVLEIGAGLGIVGAVVARNAKPKSVTSFEANPELVPEIEALYALNGLGKKISLRNQILISAPDRPETIPFHIRSSYLGSSLLNPAERPSTVVEVPTADFAEVCAETGANVLIMDIEGGELELLRHADLSQFRAIVLEFHPEAYEIAGMRECKSILTQAGFEKVNEKSTRTVWTCLRPET
ncbi:FkbM family methyltransferase [Ruegeria pomeroyi]|nr:FkbM family methyltransferase [Ruegeria pomeroyi]